MALPFLQTRPSETASACPPKAQPGTLAALRAEALAAPPLGAPGTLPGCPEEEEQALAAWTVIMMPVCLGFMLIEKQREAHSGTMSVLQASSAASPWLGDCLRCLN